MSEFVPVVLLSIPGLRRIDLPQMPALSKLFANGRVHDLAIPFPAVTWPVQAAMLTGELPNRHGVIANGFYWREKNEVEMWTADNRVVACPQIWDRLGPAGLTSAAWFPMLSKRSKADFVCMPAPVHNPDGTESTWCYTQPQDFYRELLEALGPFPLHHFWGPLAGIQSSRWIAQSAVFATKRFRPDFFYVYFPHLDYAAQKFGPQSDAAVCAVAELDELLNSFFANIEQAYGRSPHWLVASEYAIVDVDHVTFPNRILREHGLLKVRSGDDGEYLDLKGSLAWALVDHQFSHVFVRGSDPEIVSRVAALFRAQPGFQCVLTAAEKPKWNIDHPRCGDLVLLSEPNSWQAYYWWLDDRHAPAFARTVDIHRKPGYDPVELHFDPATRSIPLDARLVRGSHGLSASGTGRAEILMTSDPDWFHREEVGVTELFGAVLKHLVRMSDSGSAKIRGSM